MDGLARFCKVLHATPIAASLLFAVTLASGAQGRPTARHDNSRAGCDGRVITGIDINPGRPPFTGTAAKWQAVARSIGLHHATTRPAVIRPYLLFDIGDTCNSARLAESERLLRTLPFLADARAVATPDSSGGTQIDIVTTDEVPVTASGGLRHALPSALGLGNENIGGMGLGISVAGALPTGSYRGAASVLVQQYAAFGEPVVARFGAVRDPLGQHIDVGASHLFLSGFQRTAWQASVRFGTDFPVILSPGNVNQTVEVGDQRWSVSGALRSSIGSTLAIFGPLALQTRLSPSTAVLALTDSGATSTSNPGLASRFTPFHAVRFGGLLGLRHATYVTRTGLDALFAPQDIMTGWQVGVLGGAGGSSRAGRDALIGNSAYFGLASGSTVVVGDFEGEASHDFATSLWHSAVVNARTTAYISATPRVLLTLWDNFSSISNTPLPTQLALADPLGGPRGYIGSNIAGGRRNVLRTDLRWAAPNAIRGADVGVALFADAGSMWAGGVPYGSTVQRQSVGVSLLASYPTRSKRLYRLDLAIPLERDHNTRFEIRFTNADPTLGLSQEPGDVQQARLGPTPSSVFAWPPR